MSHLDEKDIRPNTGTRIGYVPRICSTTILMLSQTVSTPRSNLLRTSCGLGLKSE